MNFHVTLNCDNAAFSDDALEGEVARILRKVADDLERNNFDQEKSLRDYNGNAVGFARFMGKRPCA